MRRVLLFSIILIAALLIIWSFGRWQKKETVGVAEPERRVVSSLIEKSDEGEGGVTVTARPIILPENKEKNIVFEFVMDTHSGDLTDFSVLEKVSLISGDKEVLSKEWQETVISAHHRAGRLAFEVGVRQLTERELELVIRDLAGIPERRLKWTL